MISSFRGTLKQADNPVVVPYSIDLSTALEPSTEKPTWITVLHDGIVYTSNASVILL